MPAPQEPARQPAAASPESMDSQHSWPGLDRLGWLQAIGGLLLALISGEIPPDRGADGG